MRRNECFENEQPPVGKICNANGEHFILVSHYRDVLVRLFRRHLSAILYLPDVFCIRLTRKKRTRHLVTGLVVSNRLYDMQKHTYKINTHIGRDYTRQLFQNKYRGDRGRIVQQPTVLCPGKNEEKCL